jgi:DNA-directed RNA polymerase subunit M/transcription elongation factor TFIIS
MENITVKSADCTSKPKIRLSLSPILSAINPLQSSDLFDLELRPYRQKVIDQLDLTALNAPLRQVLEKSLYKKTLLEAEQLKCGRNFELFKRLYLTTCRHLIDNLRPNNYVNNLQFIDLINNNEITPELAVDMNPQIMYHDRWRVLLEKKCNDIERSTKDPESTTDMFWCGKCHRNKCKYFERQDRCADEPMTVHITCCYCGARWKQ